MTLRKLKTLFAMPATDRVLLIQAWIELLVVELLLRVWPFPKVQQRAERQFCPQRQRTFSDGDWSSVRRYQKIVGMASRYHLFPMTCLRKTLTLQALLGRRGILSELRIGAVMNVGKLKAHAWLEVSGRTLQNSPGETERFTILAPMDLER